MDPFTEKAAVRLKAVNPVSACKSSVASSKMQVEKPKGRGWGVQVASESERAE